MATQCPKCRQGTTPKSIADKGMCAACFRIWGLATYSETMEAIPSSVEAQVKEAILTTSTISLAASRMKKLHPLKFPLRNWDIALVISIDERGRTRARS